MAEQKDVRILGWPAEPARLLHAFESERPAPVALRFEPSPARVVLSSAQPLDVGMNMQVSAREPVPLCIRLCEPICVRSDYQIGITLFDRPIISLTVRGVTRLYNCNEE